MATNTINILKGKKYLLKKKVKINGQDQLKLLDRRRQRLELSMQEMTELFLPAE